MQYQVWHLMLIGLIPTFFLFLVVISIDWNEHTGSAMLVPSYIITIPIFFNFLWVGCSFAMYLLRILFTFKYDMPAEALQIANDGQYYVNASISFTCILILTLIYTGCTNKLYKHSKMKTVTKTEFPNIIRSLGTLSRKATK